MSLSISEGIESDQVLRSRVRRASQILEHVIGSTAPSVVVEWHLGRDASDRPLVLLVLSDYTGARMEAPFAPEELAKEGQLRAKLLRIWGDLLQNRSHQQLNQLSGRMDPPGR